MKDTINTLKRLLLNNDSTDKVFYLKLDEVDAETIFDALTKSTEFEDIDGHKFVITGAGINDERTEIHVKFDHADKWLRDDTQKLSINELAERIYIERVGRKYCEHLSEYEYIWKQSVEAAVCAYFNYSVIDDETRNFCIYNLKKNKDDDKNKDKED